MTAVLERAPRPATPGRRRGTSGASSVRFRPADLALLAAAAGLLGLLPLGTVLKTVLIGLFVFTGPGFAVLTWVPVPRYARLGAVPTLGAALTTLVTITAMWSYRWNTTGILVLGACAVIGSSLLWYARRGPAPAWRDWPSAALGGVVKTISAPGLNPPTVLTLAALVLWLAAVPNLPGADASYYGLVFSGAGMLLIPATAATTVAFLWAVVTRRFGAAVFALAGTVVVLRVTTWAGTQVPLYDWTYKHIGVIRYIQEHGLITPNGTDIYTQWPAFFVASAWFCDVTTLDPMTLAHLFAPLIHVLLALVVYSTARLLGQPRMTALTAAFLAEVVNWVGQDYLSPQAWAIVLAFGTLMLLLASRGAPRTALLAVVPFAAMVPSHQLTPFWVVGAAVLLVLFRRARPWWAVGAMVLIVGAYLALNLEAVAPYGIFSGGNPVANASSNVVMAGVPAKIYTSMVCRGLSLAVFGAAAAAAVWAWRTRQRHVLSRAVLAFCALGLLMAQGYGGEAIFRVYLYSLLGCALLIAPAVTALLGCWRRGVAGAVAAGLTWLGVPAAALAGLFSFYALWPIIVETRGQVEAVSKIVDEAEPGSRFMMMAASGLPTRSTAHYASMTLRDPDWDSPIELVYGSRPDTFPTPEDLAFLKWSVAQNPHPTYIMFSPQSERRMDYYGFFQPEADDRLKAILTASGEWTTVYDDGAGTVFFRHAPGKR